MSTQEVNAVFVTPNKILTAAKERLQRIQRDYATEEKRHRLGNAMGDEWSCGIFTIAIILALPLFIILIVTHSVAVWVMAGLYTVLMIALMLVLMLVSCRKDGRARDLSALSEKRSELGLYSTYGVDKTMRIKNLYTHPQFQAAQDQFVRSIDNLCDRKSMIVHPNAITDNDLLKAYRDLVNDDEFENASLENQTRSIIMEAMQQKM